MGNVISIRGLTKSFGSTRALDGLDLDVSAGEIHGFLGPNASGKTTTLRCLLGLLHADAGTATVLGLDPWRDRVALHRRLAYVPGDVALWPNLTGGEVIDLLGRLRGGLDESKRADLVERFDLDPSRKSRTYSKGNRQKVALIAALAAPVELLLLDEPTSGLDPLMAAEFRTVVREWQSQGGTALLSSHILSEAEALADRVTIIKDGRAIDSGTLEELRHLTRIRVEATLSRIPDALHDSPGIHDLSIDKQSLTCQVDNGALQELLVVLADAGVTSLTTSPPSLEDIFLQHYSRATASTP